MPGWLFWTLVGLGAWIVLSVPLALIVGRLIGRGATSRRRAAALAGPAAMRVRLRGRSRELSRSG